MKIIGLVGLIGSGKDVVSDILCKKYGYKKVVMGDIVRELATKLGRTHSRDDLQRTQKEYREKYGNEFFGSRVVKKIRENGWDKVVINGIRIPEDVKVPKREFGKDMVVVLVDVDPKIRFERLKDRKRIGDPETFEEFQRQEENEKKLFDFENVLKYVEYKIDNSGTLEDLERNVERFVKERGME
jgi:dephospho-CoA kinase